MTQPRLLFAGTPEFARASLQALCENDLAPVAVLTQPDRPAGRGKKLTPSAVKQYASERGIDVLQPQSLRDDNAVETLRQLEPDVLIVAAYGLILPQAVLDVPAAGCLNVHASLLPRWRGAAPIQAAIINGDKETGISLMSMTAGLDCGPVFVREAISIDDDETAGELHDRLAELGGSLLVQELPAILDGTRGAEPQDDAQASYANKIKTADAKLVWSAGSEQLKRHVRAYNPVPGAWFECRGERIKCWSAETSSESGEPGTVLSADADGILVGCGTGALAMKVLQRPGKRKVTSAEFARQLQLVGTSLD
ncbi:MAG: methionyl-tRNA formyltransferase [Gammaproteobacteria bacterium]|nr:methionyl-tRNA formyltransferase [Gammaproteobacteria bacterium]NNC78013.1 methionyl-tRNA formyltransferase [Woeseiaceae bacterium]